MWWQQAMMASTGMKALSTVLRLAWRRWPTTCSRWFEMERECGGGACDVVDCCVSAGCRTWPAGWRCNNGYDCASAERHGYCQSTDDYETSGDGIHAAEACCECGGGTDQLYKSCQYPTGTSHQESAVNCAAAGMTPLADDVFKMERECGGGGACGATECCVPAGCRTWPVGWRNNYGEDCAGAASQGYCQPSGDLGTSGDGIHATEACCECGGGQD
eukprot:COSAG06_NODE_1882_length_8147_cov_4.295601_5_plen_217_part_00